MEAVAAGDEIAVEHFRCAGAYKMDRRSVLGTVETYVLRFEHHRAARRNARRDQVLQHLVLGVERDRLAPGQLGEIDAVTAPFEVQLDPVMHRTLPLHPLPDTSGVEQAD